jgi:4-hydroxybenzoate polyprenyltransferase
MREPTARLAIGALAWRCFQEARPTVQGVFLLRLLSGWALTATATGPATAGGTGAGAGIGPVPPFVTGVVGWCCVVMSVYLLNGVSDIREDRVNASSRPIARGLLPARTAERVVWSLAATGVLAGFATALPLGLLALLALAVGWLYSAPAWRLKRRSSGTSAAALVGLVLTYYAGAMIAAAQQDAGGGARPGAGGGYGWRDWLPGWQLPEVGAELLVFAGALSLWAALVGGTTKDLPDVAGDRAAGTRSWLIVWGERRFRVVIAVVALCVGAGSVAAAAELAPDLLAIAGGLLAGAVAVAVLLVGPASRWWWGRRASRRSAEPRAPYRAFMVTQYAVHLVLLTDRVTAMVSS